VGHWYNQRFLQTLRCVVQSSASYRSHSNVAQTTCSLHGAQ
jgi:hypothetical protein